MQIVLATTNAHKLQEIKAVFDADPATDVIDWQLLDSFEAQPDQKIDEPVEDRDTFEGNAELKARHYAAATGCICLADDSGIEVDALGGAPGVVSARYSGVAGPRSRVDPANNAKLLRELGGVSIDRRGARYVCAMCLAIPASMRGKARGAAALFSGGVDVATLTVRGTLEGRILLPIEADDDRFPQRGRGDGGFGYDPLFVLPDDHDNAGMTTAQLTPDQKNAISHRGDASRKMLAAMQREGLF